MSGGETSLIAPSELDAAARALVIYTNRVLTLNNGNQEEIDDLLQWILTLRGLDPEDIKRLVPCLRRLRRRQSLMRRGLVLQQRLAFEVEEGLQEAEAGLRLALEAGQAGTWVRDVDSNKVAWCPRHGEIHGLARGTAGGCLADYLARIHPDDRARVKEAIDSACERGAEYCVEYRVRRADGSIRWVQGRGHPCNGADGRPAQMLGVCVDITDLKWADRRRAFAHDECHLIERVEPVLEALSGLVPALPRELADQLAGSLRRMRTVIRQVKAINQAMRQWFRQPAHETGSLPRDQLQPCRDDVDAWFAESTWLILDDAIDARAVFRLPGEPFWASLDGVLASLRNLQTNAVEALGRKGRPPYRVVFSARIGRPGRAGGDGAGPEYVILSAADTGDGVPCKVRGRVFQGRVVGRGADRGLGSQIVRRVMDDHKGLIRLATRKGVGTLVELWFPRLVDPDARPLRVQWRPYEEARKQGGVVRWIGDGALLAALNEHAAHPDQR